MSRGSYVICWAVAILVAAAPLPFGSVDPLPSAVLQICLLAVALAWITMRLGAGQAPLPWKDPLLLAGAALLGYGLLQIIPMPVGLVDLLSPSAAGLKTTYSPEPPVWTALSLYPYATWRSCVRIVCWTLAALVVRHAAVDLKGRSILAGGLVSGGLFQAGYGLFEFASGRQHIFGYAKRHFTDVATGTFISRNNYAAYLEMAMPMALALALIVLGRRAEGGPAGSLRRALARSTGRDGFRALLLLMGAFLMATALLMSRSRMGIVSAAAALVAGGLALGLRGRSRAFALASVGVAALAAVFATQIDILPVLDRFEALRDEVGSRFGRYKVWTDAAPMLAAYPLVGTGLGTWEMAFSPYRTDVEQRRIDFAHNDYLEFAAEAGLIGLALLAAGAALALRQRVRELLQLGRQDEISLGAATGLVAIGLHSLTDFHMSIPADALSVAVLAGLFLRRAGPAPLSGGLRLSASPAAPALLPGRYGAWPSRAAWAACVLALAWLGLAAASPAAAQIRSGPGSIGAAEDARSVDPHASVVSAAAPDDDLCPACRLEPYNAGRFFDAAARARGRLLKDVEAIVRAQAAGASPDPEARRYLAGRIDAALALARRGLSIAPASGRGHLEAGLLWFGRFALTGLPPQASTDFGRAIDELGKALALQPWRAAAHRRVARLMAPLWEECDERQRKFIAPAVRRALELDPSASDIKDAAARMGI